MNTLFLKILAPIVALVGLFNPVSLPPQNTVTTNSIIEQVVSTQYDVRNLETTVSNMDVRLRYIEDNTTSLGATYDIPTPVALFETSLATKITSSATSMTLVSATDKTGTSLAASTYAFILDEGSADEEMVIADCTGTACTSMTRGVSVLTGTTSVTALQHEHRRGASVKITDGPQLIILTRIMNGLGTFPNILLYKTGTNCSVGSSNQSICDKAYIDGVAVAGASNGNDTTKGIFESATAIEQASSTSVGSTAALLVTRALYASSSPVTGCNGTATVGALCAVIARNDGKINTSYIATTTTDVYRFGGQMFYTATSTFANDVLMASTSIPNLFIGTITSTSTAASTATSTITNLKISNNATTTTMTISNSCSGCFRQIATVTNTGAGPTTISGSSNVVATCSGTQIAISGGGSNTASASLAIVQSYPSASNAWTVTYTSTQNIAANTITAYAVCVNP